MKKTLLALLAATLVLASSGCPSCCGGSRQDDAPAVSK